MYKKLILTFTLAAGLSVLPNAFAAPVAKPKPTPIRQGSTIHGEDKIEVLSAFKPPVTTPGPGPKPNTTKTGGQNQEQDSTIV